MPSFDVGSIQARGVDLAASEFLNLRDVQGVVEMTVREDQACDVREHEPTLAEGLSNPGNSAKKSTIKQINLIPIDDDVVMHDESSELDQFTHDPQSGIFSLKTNDGCFLTRIWCD